MKKINNNGFVLAETLMVCVFLMIIFGMIYTNFYPIVGEYEKRETFDDVEAKYSIYWIKKMIEDSTYVATIDDKNNFNTRGFAYFGCNRINDNDKRAICNSLMTKLEVNGSSGCINGNSTCNIYITKFRIGDNGTYKFKKTVAADTSFTTFNSGFHAYVNTLPDYVAQSLNFAKYRVLAVFHHVKTNPSYYSYANIEVNR